MKECFGNYMEYPICKGHNSCEEKGCFSKTMIDKGLCDCPYKSSCHLLRQRLQVEFRVKRWRKLEDCEFHKLLKPMYEKNESEKPCMMSTCEGCMVNDTCGGMVIECC